MGPTLFSALLTGVLLVIVNNTSGLKTCGNIKADVHFLLDSSSSIQIKDFRKQINAVENIVNNFDIGARKTRVGVSVFSHMYMHVLDFNTGSDKPTALHIIQRIKFIGGGTVIHRALHQVRSDVFNAAPIRAGAERILIIFTDGFYRYASRTRMEAKLLRESGVKIFVVGIGAAVNQQQIEDIASTPSAEFVHTFASFGILLKHSYLFADKACTAIKNQTFTNDCGNIKADVHFLMDSSSSVQIKDFRKQINAIVNIVKNFDIGARKTRVGVSVFSHMYMHVLDFNTGSDKPTALRIIQRIKYIGGGTRIHQAFHRVRRDVFNAASIRAGAERILIIFTDGFYSYASRTRIEARLLRESGVMIFVVGIGAAVDQQKIEDIASTPYAEFVHTFASFGVLWKHSNLFANKACTAIKNQTFANACDETQLTDVVFMVSSNRFDQRKIDRILKASVAVIKKVGRNGAFRYGIIYDDCLKVKDLAVGELTEKSQLTSEVAKCQNTSLASLIKKLKPDIFLPRRTNNPHQFGLLFLDNTIDLKDPEIQKQSRRAYFMNLKLFVVIIGDGVSKRRVKHSLAPKERIINIDSYENLPLNLPFMFSKIFCVTRPMEKIPEPAIL